MRRTRRVLVIDDDRLLCELVRTTFELEGFDVDTAYDVIEAERVLVESRPDAILLDIGLPGIDGRVHRGRVHGRAALLFRICRTSAVCATKVLATTINPLVSLSSRCTMPARGTSFSSGA